MEAKGAQTLNSNAELRQRPRVAVHPQRQLGRTVLVPVSKVSKLKGTTFAVRPAGSPPAGTALQHFSHHLCPFPFLHDPFSSLQLLACAKLTAHSYNPIDRGLVCFPRGLSSAAVHSPNGAPQLSEQRRKIMGIIS